MRQIKGFKFEGGKAYAKHSLLNEGHFEFKLVKAADVNFDAISSGLPAGQYDFFLEISGKKVNYVRSFD